MGFLQARILEWIAIFSPTGNLPNQGIKPTSPTLQADSLPWNHLGSTIHLFLVIKSYFILNICQVHYSGMSQSGEPEGRECSSGKHWGAYPRSKWLGGYTAETKLSTTDHTEGGTFQCPQRKLRFSRLSSGLGQWDLRDWEAGRQDTLGYFSHFWVSSM